MIEYIGLILTVVSLGLVIYCSLRKRPLMLPMLGLITAILGLAALLQDSGIANDNWAFTIVFILGTGLSLISLGQIIEASS